MGCLPKTTSFRKSSSGLLLQTRSFGSRVSSFTSSSPSSLLSHLQTYISSSTPRQSNQLPVIIYSLPTSLPSSTLPSFLSLLRTSASTSIGLLSSPLPTPSSSPPSHTVSVALFDPETSRVFRSVRKGREKVTVGRWRPFNENVTNSTSFSSSRGAELEAAFKGGDWSSIWNSPGTGDGEVFLEGEASLQCRLSGLEDVDLNAIDSVIVLATPTSAPSVLQELFELAPNSNRLGIIAPPTPFVTGRPFTLYHNDSVCEDASVGLALLRPTSSKLVVGWEGLEQLSPLVCEVQEAQGNLLLDINVLPSTDTTLLPTSASSSSFSNGNPTQHLISLLASSTSPSLANAAVGKAWLGGKEKSFFLGFLGEEGKVDRIVKIMSGDPKRGGMALDSEKSFPEGSKFVFLHRPSSGFSPSDASNQSSTSSSLPRQVGSLTSFSFLTVPEASLPATSSPASSTGEVVVQEGTFRVGSEMGFLFGGRGREGSVDGGVDGGFATLVCNL